jgi:hypothetical protein
MLDESDGLIDRCEASSAKNSIKVRECGAEDIAARGQILLDKKLASRLSGRQFLPVSVIGRRQVHAHRLEEPRRVLRIWWVSPASMRTSVPSLSGGLPPLMLAVPVPSCT